MSLGIHLSVDQVFDSIQEVYESNFYNQTFASMDEKENLKNACFDYVIAELSKKFPNSDALNKIVKNKETLLVRLHDPSEKADSNPGLEPDSSVKYADTYDDEEYKEDEAGSDTEAVNLKPEIENLEEMQSALERDVTTVLERIKRDSLSIPESPKLSARNKDRSSEISSNDDLNAEGYKEKEEQGKNVDPANLDAVDCDVVVESAIEAAKEEEDDVDKIDSESADEVTKNEYEHKIEDEHKEEDDVQKTDSESANENTKGEDEHKSEAVNKDEDEDVQYFDASDPSATEVTDNRTVVRAQRTESQSNCSDKIKVLFERVDLQRILVGKPLDFENFTDDRQLRAIKMALHCCMNGPVGVKTETEFPDVGKTSIHKQFGCRTKPWKEFCKEVASIIPEDLDCAMKKKGGFWPLVDYQRESEK